MAFEQIPTAVTVLSSGLIGWNAITLTNWDTSTQSAIAAGSSVEISGTFFKNGTDLTINATSWTAIGSGNTAYLTVTPSGTAGSQILSAAWTVTAPTWVNSKNGYYASAGSNVRTVAYAQCTTGGGQNSKEIIFGKTIPVTHGSQTFTSSGTFIVPFGITSVFVTGCAAGGQGSSNMAYPNGGGGGEWAFKKPFTVVPSEKLTITIGASGSTTTIVGTNTFTLNCGANGSPSSYGNALGGSGGSGNPGGNGGMSASGGIAYAGYNGFSSGGSASPVGAAQSYAGGGGSLGAGGSYVGSVASVITNGGGGAPSLNAAVRKGGPAIIILEW